MDGRMTSRPRWPDRRAAVRHQWVVPADVEQVREALTRPTDERAPGLALSPDPTPGTLTAISRRWAGTWRHGNRAGTADVELTRLSPTVTLVELSLWPATGGPLSTILGGRGRDRVAAGIVGALGVAHTPTRRGGEPAVVGLMSPRPAGLPVMVWVGLVALLFTPTVWAFVAAQAPTPVTEERALTEHRARVQQLTPTPERATGDAGEGREEDSSDSDDVEAEPADGVRAPSPDDEPNDDPGGALPDHDAQQAADTGDETDTGDEGSAPAGDGTAPDDDGAPDGRSRGPEDGVYQYATDGGEAVAAPGGSRDYPQRTTISVTEDGCGYIERWSVLDERWDERETCTGADAGLNTQISFREFFGVEQEHVFACDEQRPADPGAREPGSSWAITCEAEDSRMDGTIEVVDVETLDVGGAAVETVHLRLDGELSGDLEGRQQTDRWIAPGHGDLLVREESQTRATVSSPMGEVDYREDYRLDLLSLRPRT